MVGAYFVLQAVQSLDIWAYNMLQQKRLLNEGNFYIKHNYGEYLPTVDELREILHSNSYTSLIR